MAILPHKLTLMSIVQLLIDELKTEAANTRKMLERVPDGQNDWRPHEKSFPIGRLSSHVAELPQWIAWILERDGLDMVATPIERKVCANHAELMQYFEEKVAMGLTALEKATDETLQQEWTFSAGERVIFKGSRYKAIRNWSSNHMIHHRGQLSVYLRLMDVPVPGMYGPSADDRLAMEAKK